jgi:nitrite reductase/ring-hydroxylating ferredoxin subunit
MDLPACVTALGEQLCGAGEITPNPALLHDVDVFAAERERIFVRPWVAVDHETRLAEDSGWFRSDVATRSVLVTRDSGGHLHALRNVCIHAGYPVCDAEEALAERLICPYHGWEYTLDGRLVEPELSSRIDPARLRLRSHRIRVQNGLLLIDPSSQTEASEEGVGSVPDWLVDAEVTRRTRYTTTWNWKFVHYFLHSSPHLFFGDSPDACIEFGPLSLMIVDGHRAALLCLIPKFAERTDFQVIEMTSEDAAERADPDAVASALREADPSLCWFDRRFADWYWSLMSVA